MCSCLLPPLLFAFVSLRGLTRELSWWWKHYLEETGRLCAGVHTTNWWNHLAAGTVGFISRHWLQTCCRWACDCSSSSGKLCPASPCTPESTIAKKPHWAPKCPPQNVTGCNSSHFYAGQQPDNLAVLFAARSTNLDRLRYGGLFWSANMMPRRVHVLPPPLLCKSKTSMCRQLC